MKHCEWIVCERTSRWAAALRIASARNVVPPQPEPRVYEVRRLSELAVRLEERPGSIAFIETHGGNLASVLTWMVESQHRYPRARFVALVEWPPSTQEESSFADSSAHRQDVLGVLLEAGASGIVDSPRHLQPALTIANLQETVERPALPASNARQPLLEWALSLLPWQET